MSLFYNKFGRFLVLPYREKIYFTLCVLGSLLMNVMIRFISVKRLAYVLGSHIENRQVCLSCTDEQHKKALRVGQLMETAAQYVPWSSTCLIEGLCVKWILNWLNIPSVFYLGALIDKNQHSMKAHAWVTVASSTVIGAPVHLDYKPVATFTTPCLIESFKGYF